MSSHCCLPNVPIPMDYESSDYSSSSSMDCAPTHPEGSISAASIAWHSGKQRRVNFAPTVEIVAIESARHLSPDEKRRLWLQKSELSHTMKTIASTVDTSLQLTPSETVAYIRAVVESYLICTPEDEFEEPTESTLSVYASRLARGCHNGQGPSQLLRGIESHLYSQMARERAQRRADYIADIVRFYRNTANITSCCDRDQVMAVAASQGSEPSKRFASILGQADAISARHQYDGTSSTCLAGPPSPTTTLPGSPGKNRQYYLQLSAKNLTAPPAYGTSPDETSRCVVVPRTA